MAGINRTTGKATDLITFSRASGGTALRKISYGPELVTNGTFDTDTDWTKGAGWTIGSGVASISGAVAISDLRQAIGVVDGKVYQVSFDVTAISANGRLYLMDPTYLKPPITTTGTKTFTVVSSASRPENIRIRALSSDASPMTATIDNISVKEVLFDQPDGTLTLFNHPTNIPRIEYDAAGNVKGLLIEEARTNLVTYSEPSVSGFGVSRSSLSTSTTTSPNGGFAQKLTEDASVGLSHYLGTGALGMALNTTYTMSWFAKAAERNFIAMNIYSGTTSYWTWFDLSNGTVGTATNSPTTFIEDYGDGWYRCGITVTTAASGTPNTATYIAPSNGVLNYDGDGTSGIYIYGAQLEEGSFPTSYIPTSGATATRAADIASISVDNFGYNQKAGTVVVEAQRFGTNNYPRTVMIDSGSESESIGLGAWGATTSVVGYVVDNGTVQAVMGTGNAGAAVFKNALTYKENDFAASRDGSTPVTDTSGTVPLSVNTMRFGRNEVANQHLNGHIKSIAYYPRRLSNAQLQELTA